MALALAALAGLAACGAPATQAVPGNAAAESPSPDIATPRPSPPEPSPADPPLDRIADIRIGMTLADLHAGGIEARKGEPIDAGNSCTYARLPARKDLSVMLDGETVARIDVDSPAYPTLGGVTVGMSEAEAVRRLAGRVKVEPHHYTGPVGHYLVVHKEGAPLGLILETDGNIVERYRIGRWEQVQWVEGCS